MEVSRNPRTLDGFEDAVRQSALAELGPSRTSQCRPAGSVALLALPSPAVKPWLRCVYLPGAGRSPDSGAPCLTTCPLCFLVFLLTTTAPPLPISGTDFPCLFWTVQQGSTSPRRKVNASPRNLTTQSHAKSRLMATWSGGHFINDWWSAVPCHRLHDAHRSWK